MTRCLISFMLFNSSSRQLRMRHFAFNSLNDVGWLAMLVATAIACLVCIGLLSRYERRLVTRRLGWTLLVLRLGVVATVFLTLLEPVLTWTVDRTKTGRVLISVDLSDSMSTIDKQANQSERLRWLRAMNMIGNESINDRLDHWQQAFDEDREPEWVEADETRNDREREELASTRRSQLAELMQSVEQFSRKEMALRMLKTGPAPLHKQLKERALVEWQVFAGRSQVIDEGALSELVQTPDPSLQPGASDLMAGLTPVRGDDPSAPLAGVVLITDGRENAALDVERLLSRVRSFPVPVYPVIMGSQQRPRDLAIGELDSPETIYQNDTAVLTAQVRTPGFDGQEVTVTLDSIDDPHLSQTQTLIATGNSTEVTFDLDAAQVGRRRYVIRVEPQDHETRDDNNEKPFHINVVDDDTRTLVLSGIATWEFRFLDNALARDPHIEVDAIVFQQPSLGVLPETFFPRTLMLPEQIEDASQSPFAHYDAVIVGDIAPTDLSEQAWTLLDRFVRDEGGTLVLTAGKHGFPQAHQSPVLKQLLPVEGLRNIEATVAQDQGPPSVRGFHLHLTPEGSRQQFLQFDADREANERIWAQLPGHSWGLTGTARAASTVFAALRDETGEGGLDFERQHAMIVHQHAGAGQVLWVGIDSTWRWRHRVGDQFHHRFWGQIARWAATFRASAGNEHVRFGPEKSEVELGDDVLLKANWNSHFLNAFPDLQARAEIFLQNADHTADPVLTVTLEPARERPLLHEGIATNLPAGEYRVELHVEHADLGEEPVSAALIVSEKPTVELTELAADRDLLQQIAEATGGRLFLPDEVDEIPDLFADVTKHESSQEEITLWDHWLVLLLCFGLLTTEWLFRKLNGLP